MDKLELQWAHPDRGKLVERVHGRRGRLTFCTLVVEHSSEHKELVRYESGLLDEYLEQKGTVRFWTSFEEASKACQKAFEALLGELLNCEAP